MEHSWAYNEGLTAFMQNIDVTMNPYPHDAKNWWFNEEWKRGWEQAEWESDQDWDDD